MTWFTSRKNKRSSEKQSILRIPHCPATPRDPRKSYPHFSVQLYPSLSLGLDLLLANSLSLNLNDLHILIRRWSVLPIGVDTLISASLGGASKLHPEEDDGLSDQHAHCRSSHTECHTNEDRYEDDLNGGSEDHSHLAQEAVVVVMTVVARRLELDVGRKLHCSIGTTVRNACLVTLVTFVVVLVSSELVEAFDTEAFHLVRCSLG